MSDTRKKKVWAKIMANKARSGLKSPLQTRDRPLLSRAMQRSPQSPGKILSGVDVITAPDPDPGVPRGGGEKGPDLDQTLKIGEGEGDASIGVERDASGFQHVERKWDLLKKTTWLELVHLCVVCVS